MSGNPNPQHNPTDGLGVAAKITLTADGQGGSLLVTIVPNRQYQITLSKSAVSGWNASATITAAVVDVNGGVYDVQGAVLVNNYTDPAAGSPAFYKPSNFAGYDPSVASNSAVTPTVTGGTFIVTALAVGHGKLNVAFPTFDNTEASPAERVFATLDVIVIP
jgi:hypothetical protein